MQVSTRRNVRRKSALFYSIRSTRRTQWKESGNSGKGIRDSEKTIQRFRSQNQENDDSITVRRNPGTAGRESGTVRRQSKDSGHRTRKMMIRRNPGTAGSETCTARRQSKDSSHRTRKNDDSINYIHNSLASDALDSGLAQQVWPLSAAEIHKCRLMRQ